MLEKIILIFFPLIIGVAIPFFLGMLAGKNSSIAPTLFLWATFFVFCWLLCLYSSERWIKKITKRTRIKMCFKNTTV